MTLFDLLLLLILFGTFGVVYFAWKTNKEINETIAKIERMILGPPE